jgi:L-fuculose-phosphate aldolase
MYEAMTTLTNEHLKAELSRYSKRAVERGLAAGPGGNTSVRDGDTLWISPSGLALDEIGDDEWVGLDIESGTNLTPQLRASSEFLMHLGIYRSRPDVASVIHTHPTVTIAVISAGIETIPFMFPDHVAVVGELGAVDYIVPCTSELADAVQTAIGVPGVSGLLLRNHGLITVGSTVKEAYYRTEITEEAARIWWIAQAIGIPRTLTISEQQDILNLEAEQYRQAVLRNQPAARSH